MRFLAFVSALVALGCGDDVPLPADAGERDSGRDGSSSPVTFTVATWNVENFFDEVNDPETFDEVPSPSEVARKIENVARVLRALDADVIALQEVENTALLDRLADGPLSDMGYTERHLIDSFDPRGIDVACLARVPVTNVVSHQGERFSGNGGEYFFARDALEIFAEPGGVPVIVMVLHLRSMLDGGDDHRLAEAMQARRIADRRYEMGFARLLIAGDLNDLPTSVTLQSILESDRWTNLTEVVPDEDRWTFTFRGRRQQIDYLIGSPELTQERGEVRIIHGPEVDAASDHSPIRASFVLQR